MPSLKKNRPDIKNENNSDFDSFKQIIRGGQVFLHNLRMIGQVLNKVMLWTLPIAFLFGIVCFLEITEKYDRYLGGQWIMAEMNDLIFDDTHKQNITDPQGNLIEGTAKQIINSAVVNDSLKRLIIQSEKSLGAAFVFYLLTILRGSRLMCGKIYGLESKIHHQSANSLTSVRLKSTTLHSKCQ